MHSGRKRTAHGPRTLGDAMQGNNPLGVSPRWRLERILGPYLEAHLKHMNYLSRPFEPFASLACSGQVTGQDTASGKCPILWPFDLLEKHMTHVCGNSGSVPTIQIEFSSWTVSVPLRRLVPRPFVPRPFASRSRLLASQGTNRAE